MRRRHGQRMGCCELAVIAFALFVAFQFAVLGLRVLHEILVFAGTLVKWVGLGIAGAAGIAVLGGLVFGTGYAISKAFKGLFNWGTRREEKKRRESVSYYRQAREWRSGIATTVRRLQKRDWLSRDDGRRYRESADSAVDRVRSIERDLGTFRSLPASEEWVRKLDEVARNLVSRLERTHRALARLLAESALQRAPTVEMELQDATDELESLIAALEDINGDSSVPDAIAAVQRDTSSSGADEPAEARRPATDELVQ